MTSTGTGWSTEGGCRSGCYHARPRKEARRRENEWRGVAGFRSRGAHPETSAVRERPAMRRKGRAAHRKTPARGARVLQKKGFFGVLCTTKPAGHTNGRTMWDLSLLDIALTRGVPLCAPVFSQTDQTTPLSKDGSWAVCIAAW